MNRRTVAKSIGITLSLMALPACDIFGLGGRSGLSSVDDLVGWVERVHVESEVAKERARTAVDSLLAVASNDFEGDAVLAYTQFVESIEASKRQAQKLNSIVESMKRAAEPVFLKWEEDLENFSSMQMRQRSRTRLSDTRRRYEAVVDAVDPAQKLFHEVNISLRDHALYLNHDLNPGSVAEIRDDIRAVASMSQELEGMFDVCLEAARIYVESAALPAMLPAAPGGAAAFDEAPAMDVPLPPQVRRDRDDR